MDERSNRSSRKNECGELSEPDKEDGLENEPVELNGSPFEFDELEKNDLAPKSMR